MNGKEILSELKKYNIYRDQTDYTIKKSIGKTKLATVDELKAELLKLSQPVNNDTLIRVGREMYSEEDLIKMILFYKQYHQQQTNYLENKDILNNIMLQSDIYSTNALLRTNKMAMTNDNQFWLNKIQVDYPLIVPKTTNYKEEYKKIYQEHVRAKQFIEVLKLIKKDAEKDKDQCNFEELYFGYNDREMNFEELAMLPSQIKNNLKNINEPMIHFTMNKERKKDVYHFKLNLEGIKKRKHELITSVELNECEIIMFFTALLYYEPNIEIADGDETPYLYNPYALQPSEPTEEWQCIWKYWKKVLPKK
jgi:hypothetical protein